MEGLLCLVAHDVVGVVDEQGSGFCPGVVDLLLDERFDAVEVQHRLSTLAWTLAPFKIPSLLGAR